MIGVPHLLHVFSTFGHGGPQARTAEILDGLGEAYRHTIVAMDGCLDAADWVHPRLDVDFLALRHRHLGRTPTLRLLLLLRRLAPELVLTYNWGAIQALAAARLGGWPLIHAEDGFNPDEAGGQKLRRIWARRLLFRGVDAVVLPSRGLEEIAARDWWVPPERRLLLPNGVDCGRFAPGEAPRLRRDLGLRSDDLLVGTVGHLAGSKNVGLLVRALQRLDRDDVHLLVVGDGPQRPDVLGLAEELGVADRVVLAGAQPDVAPYLAAMDVFALGSRTEQMPIALLEAMAAGLPVAATDVGDVRRMLAGPNRSCVVPSGDVGAMTDALATLLADRELRHRIGAANRERCTGRYDLASVIGRYRLLYNRVLAREPVASIRSEVSRDRSGSSRAA